MHLPGAQKFDKEKLEAVKLTPWSGHRAADPAVSFRDPVQDQQQMAPGEIAKV